MKNLKTGFVSPKIIKLLSIIFLILVFIFPVLIFGIVDQEDYNYGYFSSRIIGQNYLNPYIFFSDTTGPGINFPMGNGILFNPFLLFANNSKIFYFFIIFFHLSIQSYFFIKINKLFKIRKYVIYFVPLIIFSNTNFNYHYSDDWLTASSSFSFLFLVLYYFLKIIKKNTTNDYLKFLIVFFFFFENAHVGYIFFTIIFLTILFLFSDYKVKIIKSRKPYFFSFLLFLLLLEKVYYYIDIYNYVNLYKNVSSNINQSNAGLIDFFNSLFPIKEYFTRINRLPSNPFLIVIAILFLFFLKNKKNFLNFKLVFSILLIFNFTNILNFLDFIFSATWWVRDFTLIFSCIICLQYFDKVKDHLKIIIIFILFSYSALILAKNYSGVMHNTNNFIVSKPQSFKMINFFENLKLENNLNRIYLSPESFKLFSKSNSAKYGIYSPRDLYKFNLSTFNGTFKNVKSPVLFTTSKISHYYSEIPTNMDYLKNLFFLSVFKINYSLVSENEITQLDKRNYTLLDELEIENIKYLFIRNKISLLGIKNLDTLKNKTKNCETTYIDCIILNKNLFSEIKGSFNKEKNSLYKINLAQKSELFTVIPFVFDKNWKCNEDECLNIGNFLMLSKNLNGNIDIKFEDNLRFILRNLSFLILIFLLLGFRQQNSKITSFLD